MSGYIVLTKTGIVLSSLENKSTENPDRHKRQAKIGIISKNLG